MAEEVWRILLQHEHIRVFHLCTDRCDPESTFPLGLELQTLISCESQPRASEVSIGRAFSLLAEPVSAIPCSP